MVMSEAAWRRSVPPAFACGDVSEEALGRASAMSSCISAVIIAGGTAAKTSSLAATPRLVANWQVSATVRPAAAAVAVVPVDADTAKVLRFVRLVHHLSTAPWACRAFGPNDAIMNRLVASHLPIIVGHAGFHPRLYNLIDSGDRALASARNLVWVTNRQQGKTTTLGKFIAALSLASGVAGGVLCCVYSTKQERAAELLKAAKEYIGWMKTPAGTLAGFEIAMIRDNERRFEVSTNGGHPQTVMARPKNPDTCRGDAFWAGIFDEAAFTSADFWYKFAMPLLQIRDRVFTCCTTPAPPKGFFATFCEAVKRSSAAGDTFFTLVNHSLSCARCLDVGEGPRCCHRLWLIPPWKPQMALSSISALMPKSRSADFAAEVFGVMKDTFNGYIPQKLIDASLIARTRAIESPFGVAEPPTVWVGIDPASHGVSAMALTAVAATSGTLFLIGAATVNVHRCEAIQVQAVVAMFLAAVRAHPWVTRSSALVPIVECNNNEVMALTIVKVFDDYAPVWQPFVAEAFPRNISPGIGVWTTERTKAASLQILYQAFLDGAVAVSPVVAAADGTAFSADAPPAVADNVVRELAEQVGRFSDDPATGKITGKIDGENDDIGMALLLSVYWRLCVLNVTSNRAM